MSKKIVQITKKKNSNEQKNSSNEQKNSSNEPKNSSNEQNIVQKSKMDNLWIHLNIYI